MLAQLEARAVDCVTAEVVRDPKRQAEVAPLERVDELRVHQPVADAMHKDIRSGIALPQSRQFEILSVTDPYNCTTNPTTGLSAIPTTGSTTGAVSLYRRPLPTTNIGLLTTLLWDGREPDLFSLSLHATRNRLQSTTEPTPAQLQQMVTLQGCDFKNQEHRAIPPQTSQCAQTPPGSGIFTAQFIDDDAGYLNAAGARGGPKALSQDLAGFFFGINDPFPGGNPIGAPFRPDIFHLYDAWGRVARARSCRRVSRGNRVRRKGVQ